MRATFISSLTLTIALVILGCAKPDGETPATIQSNDVDPSELYQATLGTLSASDRQVLLSQLSLLPSSYPLTLMQGNSFSATGSLNHVSLAKIADITATVAPTAETLQRQYPTLGAYWQQDGAVGPLGLEAFTSGLRTLLNSLQDPEALTHAIRLSRIILTSGPINEPFVFPSSL